VGQGGVGQREGEGRKDRQAVTVSFLYLVGWFQSFIMQNALLLVLEDAISGCQWSLLGSVGM